MEGCLFDGHNGESVKQSSLADYSRVSNPKWLPIFLFFCGVITAIFIFWFLIRVFTVGVLDQLGTCSSPNSWFRSNSNSFPFSTTSLLSSTNSRNTIFFDRTILVLALLSFQLYSFSLSLHLSVLHPLCLPTSLYSSQLVLELWLSISRHDFSIHSYIR